MSNKKDVNWLDNKVQDIKKRKRALHNLFDPIIKKKITKDLITERRAAKRSEKQTLKKWIDNQDFENEDDY